MAIARARQSKKAPKQTTKKAASRRKKAEKSTTPAGYDLGASYMSSLPESVQSAIANSWALGTTKNHRSGFKNYLTWCESEGISGRSRFPASEALLCEYAASWQGKEGSASLPSKINGIRAFHLANGEDWSAGTALKQVMEGVKKMKPRSKKKTRPPVTLQRLEILSRGLDPSDPQDACVAAIASIAFYSQCRLGELLPESPNEEKIPEFHYPKMEDFGEQLSLYGSRTLHLPYTKTKKEEGEEVTVCAQRGITNPVAALEHHMAMNDLAEGEYLASYVTDRGERRILTKKKFMLRCNEIWMKEGWSRLTGHSFRIGGTTYFLLKGIKPDVVKALGRWSSDAFLRYWRQLELLGIMYIERI